MKVDALIDEIFFKGYIFHRKNYTREHDEIFITISRTNVQKIVNFYVYIGLIRPELNFENIYGKIKVHGFRILSSEMLTDEEIVIGLIEKL